MTSTLSGPALIAAYVASWLSLRRSRDVRGTPTRVRPAAVLLWVAVAVSSVAGLVWPAWLAVGGRELGAVLQGQVWRLVTSMFLQDGGVRGTVFNLVTLAITVLLVGSAVRQRTLVLGFLASGVVANVLTLALLGQGGAGNSMATLGLVGAAAAYLALTPGSSAVSRVLVGVVALVALGLDLVPDQHGPALTVGVVAGAALAIRVRRPGRGSVAA